MTDRIPETPDEDSELPDDADRELAAGHDDAGTDLARIIARASRGDPAGVPRRRTDADRAGKDPEVVLPPPRGVRGTGGRRRGRRNWAWSGSGPDRRDPVPLGRAFDRLVSEKGWTREVSLHVVLARWPELVGPANAGHTWPVGYEKTILTVQADSTVWATSLRAIAPNLVAELNSRLGEGTVTRVVVQGPNAPSWKHGPRSVPGRGPRDTYG
ncbi:DUF721 domain-containing protein [Acidipropionibacterium virtanenii]|uniref:Uncharacterized protein n=1 Tax=Acidipropionibacterium virtanenii TaxID=2057246 RepID=A0A344UPK8_9ACTN|nr:DciA family protein [Acidipropionibacterium virtanenii]AXE37206.1 hypothetical protein JS278_00007 [Acidipropionibacterium virtanenii]